MMPCGSIARLMARMSSSAAGFLVALELADLELADAVLGADAAAVRGDEVVDGAADSVGPRRERAAIAAGRLAQVVVQVAVAEMAVGDETRARREPRRAVRGPRR